MAFFQVLEEALFLPTKNTKLFASLYLIIAAVFAPLLAWHCFGVMPLILHIVDLYKQGSQIPAGTVLNCAVTAALFLFACIATVTFLSTGVTIPSACLTYIGATSISARRILRSVNAKVTLNGPVRQLAYIHIGYAAMFGGLAVAELALMNSWPVWPALFWTLAIVFFFRYLFRLAYFFVDNALGNLFTVAITYWDIPPAETMYEGLTHIAWGLVMQPSRFVANAIIMLLFLFVDRLLGVIYVKAVAASYYDHRVFLAIVLGVIYVMFLAGFFLYLSNVLVLASVQLMREYVFPGISFSNLVTDERQRDD